MCGVYVGPAMVWISGCVGDGVIVLVSYFLVVWGSAALVLWCELYRWGGGVCVG